jgi:CheY-like chemotaxis protein
VVVNLLSNALKFTQAGGHVEIRVQVGETTASVSVSDDGQGIEPAFLPHLFERFSQARGDAGRRHAGLGLGLAIVRQLVELHGGQLRAHSDGPGCGSVFTVELPLLDAPLPTSTPTPSAPAEDGRPIRVLVVEDQEAMRDYLARILGDAGMDATVAASAAEALQRLGPDGLRPQLLVSDIGMPDVDGYELMRRIRETLGLDASVLPAIAVTAFARSEDRDRAIKAGFQAHVAKPVQATRLVELAREFARVPPADHPPDRVH